MKKWIAWLTALALLLALSGCGAAPEPAVETPITQTAETTEPEPAATEAAPTATPDEEAETPAPETTEKTNEEEKNVTVVSLEDRTLTEEIFTADALELFWEDENGKYYFPSIKSQYIIVHFSDGSSMNVVEALESGAVTLPELEAHGLGYIKEEKAMS